MTCHLYVIAEQTEQSHGIQGASKIGVSSGVDLRLAALQSSSPRILEVKRTWEFVDFESAYDFEQAIHKRLSHKRVYGEWFNLRSSECIFEINRFIDRLSGMDGFLDHHGRYVMLAKRRDTKLEYISRVDMPHGRIVEGD